MDEIAEKKVKRLFIASSETFSEYQLEISLLEVSTIEDIITIFKDSLKELFEKNNLTILAQKLEKAQFHIHSYTIEDILTSNHEDYFFICDHS